MSAMAMPDAGSAISLQFRVEQLQRVIEEQKEERGRQARNSSALQQEMERALEEQVRVHSTQLGALQQLVIERESRLSALQQQVAARDKELVELRRAVAKCDARMSELNRVLSSRTRGDRAAAGIHLLADHGTLALGEAAAPAPEIRPASAGVWRRA